MTSNAARNAQTINAGRMTFRFALDVVGSVVLGGEFGVAESFRVLPSNGLRSSASVPLLLLVATFSRGMTLLDRISQV